MISDLQTNITQLAITGTLKHSTTRRKHLNPHNSHSSQCLAHLTSQGSHISPLTQLRHIPYLSCETQRKSVATHNTCLLRHTLHVNYERTHMQHISITTCMCQCPLQHMATHSTCPWQETAHVNGKRQHMSMAGDSTCPWQETAHVCCETRLMSITRHMHLHTSHLSCETCVAQFSTSKHSACRDSSILSRSKHSAAETPLAELNALRFNLTLLTLTTGSRTYHNTM